MSGETVAAEIRAAHQSTAAQIDPLRRENATTRWLIGLGFTSLGILMAVIALLLR